jgi:hypothetical protein
VGLIAAKLLRLVRRPAAEAGGRGPTRTSAPDGRDTLIHTFMQAASEYVPLPYPGKVVVFWPAEEPEPAADSLRWWRRVSPRAEIETIPGDHLTSITVHAQALARRLAARLDAGSGP